MKKYVKYLLTLSAAAAILTGCGGSDSSGNIQSAKVIDDIPSATMLNYVKALDPNASFAFGYKAVKLTYTTKTPDGKEVEFRNTRNSGST